MRLEVERWSQFPGLPSGSGGSASTNGISIRTTTGTSTRRSTSTSTSRRSDGKAVTAWTPIAETTPVISLSEITGSHKPNTPSDQDHTPICDFQRLHIGAALLRPPLDIAANRDLGEWQAAARQLGELQRLLDVHRDAIAAREGTQELERFRQDLANLVERRLRDGCATLQYLQTELLGFRHGTASHSSSRNSREGDRGKGSGGREIGGDDERRTVMAAILLGVEIEVLNSILASPVRGLLPAWARRAPELQSERCPDRDCFRIGDAAIDIVTFEIPNKLLDDVQRLRLSLGVGGWEGKIDRGPVGFGTQYTWISEVFLTVQGMAILGLISIVVERELREGPRALVLNRGVAKES
ncbi:hypothetical protein F5Y14DRAFT_453688 [Nemania sp. NC0429]|nr:hypothetical protein F5Y14DRAFT_453688 [Nemania sp. NC0429]